MGYRWNGYLCHHCSQLLHPLHSLSGAPPSAAAGGVGKSLSTRVVSAKHVKNERDRESGGIGSVRVEAEGTHLAPKAEDVVGDLCNVILVGDSDSQTVETEPRLRDEGGGRQVKAGAVIGIMPRHDICHDGCVRDAGGEDTRRIQ